MTKVDERQEEEEEGLEREREREARRGRGLVGIAAARTAEEDLRGGDAAME